MLATDPLPPRAPDLEKRLADLRTKTEELINRSEGILADSIVILAHIRDMNRIPAGHAEPEPEPEIRN